MATTITRKKGDTFYDPATGKAAGSVEFDANTGLRLQDGQSFTETITTAGTAPVVSPYTPGAIAADAVNTKVNPVVTAGTAPVGTANVAVEAAVTANNEAVKSQRQIERDAAQKTVTQDQSSIVKLIQDIGNKGKIQEDIYEDLEVDTKRQKVDQYTNEIEQEQLANRREIDQIKKNNPGMTEFALNSEVRRINDASLSRQADLAILQSSSLRDYSTAAAIADRQVEAKLEPMRAELEARKFFYENNKDVLDKADAALIREEERALNQKEKELDIIKDMKLSIAKNGAPASVLNSLSNANTLDEALSTPGINKYFTSPAEKLDLELKRAQINATNRSNRDSGTGGVSISAPKATNYTLKAGDDPYNIAVNSGVSIDALKAANPGIKDWNNIKVGVTLKVPPANDNSAIVGTILGSGKFTKDQAAAVASAINSGQDPATVIRNQAKNIMGQTEANKLTNYEVARSQMQDINSLLKQFYAKGGSTSYLTGNYENAINKLGNVVNPEQVGIATQIASALQVYRNAVSGTAYSVQEGEQINKIFPGIDKSQGLNQAVIDGRLKAFDSTIDSTYQAVLGDGYKSLKNTGKSATDNYFNTAVSTVNNINQQTASKEGSFLQSLGF